MKAKILCVDDEMEIRHEITEELKDFGYATLQACNGVEGLEAITNHKPDLVICDVTMPAMDGHSLLRRLRNEHPEQADLPFIFLSALAERSHIVQGKRLGADDYLTKPIDFEMLLATVEARLNQVQRMTARKQEQLVKVYRAASTGDDMNRSNLDLLVGVPGREQSIAALHPAARAAPSDVEQKSKIQEIVKRSPTRMVGGRIELVGLDEIRDSFGTRWQDVADKIGEIAESTLRRRLSPMDVIDKMDNGDFLVCFANLSDAEAGLKAGAICREIRNKILGNESIDAEAKDACDVRSETHEINISPKEISEADNVLPLIVDRLGQAVKRARAAEQRCMAQVVEESEVAPVTLMSAKGGELPLALAELDEGARGSLARLQRGRPGSAELAAEIDYLRLGKTAEAICQAIPEASPIMVVDVDFSTLNYRRFRSHYLQLCASLTRPVCNHLAFNVCNISSELLPARILSNINHIRPYCRLVMFETLQLDLGGLDPAALRAKLVSCDLSKMSVKLGAYLEDLKQLADLLHRRQCRLLVRNIGLADDMRRVIKCGADFVSRRP